MPELSEQIVARYTTDLIASVLERLCVPFLLLDGTGRIGFTNGLAADILADGNHLGPGSDGRLEAHGLDAAAALRNFLAALGDNPAEIDIRIESRGGGSPLFVSLSPYLPPALPGFSTPLPIAVVFIREGDDAEGIEAARSRFGLTRAETDVVQAIVAGQTVTAYARARGLSVHTARKQLNSAMQKAGVSRQSQLTHLIDEISGRGRDLATAQAMAGLHAADK